MTVRRSGAWDGEGVSAFFYVVDDERYDKYLDGQTDAYEGLRSKGQMTGQHAYLVTWEST